MVKSKTDGERRAVLLVKKTLLYRQLSEGASHFYRRRLSTLRKSTVIFGGLP